MSDTDYKVIYSTPEPTQPPDVIARRKKELAELRKRKQGLFPHGQIVTTAHAMEVLELHCMFAGLKRHLKGDWGECCKEDAEMNDDALENRGRLFSVYRDKKNQKFWIITEHDRSVTTILLPEDY